MMIHNRMMMKKLLITNSNNSTTNIIVRRSSTGSIFRLSKANKTGLSNMLDGTMRNGSHDMKTFGSGIIIISLLLSSSSSSFSLYQQ